MAVQESSGTWVQVDEKLPLDASLRLHVMGKQEQRVELRERELTVGSDPGCDVVIVGDPEVSARHLRLKRVQGGVRVIDLKSKNGVLVHAPHTLRGGTKLGWRALWRPGLWLRIGQTALALELVPPPSLRAGDFHGMVGRSLAMQALYEQIRKYAPIALNVLLHGQTGAGKELVAHALHQESLRKGRPFVPINCATLRPDLAPSELFGHTRGAFTSAVSDTDGAFGQAHGGTLFLDEVAELPLAVQPMLLRALAGQITRVGEAKARQVDVRVISATHVDLDAAMQAKRFRTDLYYRLCTVKLEVPSLLSRVDDVPDLVERFSSHFPLEHKPTWSPEALEKLKGHGWPGNVRELQGTVLSALAHAHGKPVVEPEDVRFDGPQAEDAKAFDANAIRDLKGMTLAEIEAYAIRAALARHPTKLEAAQELQPRRYRTSRPRTER